MDVSASFLVLVPIVLGLVQVAKSAGLSSKWAPILSLALGIIGAGVIGWGISSEIIIQGIIAGLSAAGLWSGTKATVS
jgi:hypothetical protein